MGLQRKSFDVQNSEQACRVHRVLRTWEISRQGGILGGAYRVQKSYCRGADKPEPTPKIWGVSLTSLQFTATPISYCGSVTFPNHTARSVSKAHVQSSIDLFRARGLFKFHIGAQDGPLPASFAGPANRKEQHWTIGSGWNGHTGASLAQSPRETTAF